MQTEEEASYRVYLDERRALVEAEKSGSQQFDKAILTLAAGALAISLTFIKNIAPHPKDWTIYFLLASWIGFIISLLCTLCSFLTSQAAFRFAASACPERHLKAAGALGVDISRAKLEDAGKILADRVIEIMKSLRIPNGLSAIGYTEEDIPKLVEGTLPQHRVVKLSPRPAGAEELARVFKDAMVYW